MPLDSDNEIFVRIENEFGIRTSLLESAKLTTHLSKNSETVVAILKQKKKEKFRLKLLVSEMKSLINSIDLKELPQSEEKHHDEKVVLQKKETKPVIKKEIKKDKLTLELEEIEKRLHNLKI